MMMSLLFVEELVSIMPFRFGFQPGGDTFHLKMMEEVSPTPWCTSSLFFNDAIKEAARVPLIDVEPYRKTLFHNLSVVISVNVSSLDRSVFKNLVNEHLLLPLALLAQFIKDT